MSKSLFESIHDVIKEAGHGRTDIDIAKADVVRRASANPRWGSEKRKGWLDAAAKVQPRATMMGAQQASDTHHAAVHGSEEEQGKAREKIQTQWVQSPHQIRQKAAATLLQKSRTSKKTGAKIDKEAAAKTLQRKASEHSVSLGIPETGAKGVSREVSDTWQGDRSRKRASDAAEADKKVKEKAAKGVNPETLPNRSRGRRKKPPAGVKTATQTIIDTTKKLRGKKGEPNVSSKAAFAVERPKPTPPKPKVTFKGQKEQEAAGGAAAVAAREELNKRAEERKPETPRKPKGVQRLATQNAHITLRNVKGKKGKGNTLPRTTKRIGGKGLKPDRDNLEAIWGSNIKTRTQAKRVAPSLDHKSAPHPEMATTRMAAPTPRSQPGRALVRTNVAPAVTHLRPNRPQLAPSQPLRLTGPSARRQGGMSTSRTRSLINRVRGYGASIKQRASAIYKKVKSHLSAY